MLVHVNVIDINVQRKAREAAHFNVDYQIVEGEDTTSFVMIGE